MIMIDPGGLSLGCPSGGEEGDGEGMEEGTSLVLCVAIAVGLVLCVGIAVGLVLCVGIAVGLVRCVGIAVGLGERGIEVVPPGRSV